MTVTWLIKAASWLICRLLAGFAFPSSHLPYSRQYSSHSASLVMTVSSQDLSYLLTGLKSKFLDRVYIWFRLFFKSSQHDHSTLHTFTRTMHMCTHTPHSSSWELLSLLPDHLSWDHPPKPIIIHVHRRRWVRRRNKNT